MFKGNKQKTLITTTLIQFTTKMVKDRSSASIEQFPLGSVEPHELLLTRSFQAWCTRFNFWIGFLFYKWSMFPFKGNLIYSQNT